MTCFGLATRNACRGRWLPALEGRTGLSTHNNIAKPICLRLISGALYGFATHPDRPVVFVPSSQDPSISTLLIEYRSRSRSHCRSLQVALLYYCLLSNMPSRSFTLSFSYATLVAAASQKCYSLTGSELDNTFAPCNSTAKHSGCCATNKSVGADICLDSGLCMATSGQYMGTIWQPGCTDSTGKATECPQLCPGCTYTPISFI